MLHSAVYEARRQHQHGGDDRDAETNADLDHPEPTQRQPLITKEPQRPLLFVGEGRCAAQDPDNQRRGRP